MSKFLKRFFQIILLLGVLLIIFVIGVTLFVDPNQFKGQIEQQVAKKTGYNLSLQGPLVWRWFPMLSLELNQIRLGAAGSFTDPLLTAKSAKVEAELLPLLTGKLFLNLGFDNLVLLLEKNPKGQGNWESLKQSSPAVKRIEETTEASSASPAQSSSLQHFVLNSINIKNGQLLFKDNAKQTFYKLTNLNLAAKNLVSHTLQNVGVGTPVSLSFKLENAKSQSLGSLTLSSLCAMPTADQITLQKLALKFITPEGMATDLSGEATIQDLNASPSVKGFFETRNVNLHAWLKGFNIATGPEIPSIINIKTTFTYKDPALKISSFNITSNQSDDLKGTLDIMLGGSAEKALNLKGQFSSNQLKIGKFNINELQGNLAAEGNVITVSPIDFKIAKMPQHASLEIDLRGATPRYSLNAESQGFEINQLLGLFNVKDKLQGKTQYQAKLTTVGKTAEEWRRNLSGQANIEVGSGKFYGKDLIHLLKSAQSNVHDLVASLVNKQSFNLKNFVQTEGQKWNTPSSSDKSATPFNVAKVTANINNGSINKSTLLIEHTEYKVSGEGSCDLNNFAVNYHLAALLKNNPYPADDKVGAYLYSVPLPIKINGTLENPIVRPDLDSYTQTAFNYAQKHLLRDFIDKGLNKALEHFIKKQ